MFQLRTWAQPFPPFIVSTLSSPPSPPHLIVPALIPWDLPPPRTPPQDLKAPPFGGKQWNPAILKAFVPSTPPTPQHKHKQYRMGLAFKVWFFFACLSFIFLSLKPFFQSPSTKNVFKRNYYFLDVKNMTYQVENRVDGEVW